MHSTYAYAGHMCLQCTLVRVCARGPPRKCARASYVRTRAQVAHPVAPGADGLRRLPPEHRLQVPLPRGAPGRKRWRVRERGWRRSLS